MIEDKEGNQIYRDKSNIVLSLAKESRSRVLGVLLGDTIIVRRSYEKHFFRKMQGFGFNYSFLSTCVNTKTVVLKTDRGDFKIPIAVILDKGKFLHFKKLGFELQIFFPETDLAQYIV